MFNWDFIEYDPLTKDLKVLKSGTITDIINTPKILGKYNEKTIIFFTENNGEVINYEFAEYFEKSLVTLMKSSGSIKPQKDYLPYNVYNYYIYDNYIYYSLLDKSGNQRIYSYNLLNKDIKILFENNSNEGFINNYKLNKENQYFQIIYSYNSNSKIIIKKGDEITKEISTKINTFDTFIDENRILFHNQGFEWKIFDFEKLEFKFLNFNIKSNPKYHFVSKNKILISSKDSRYFIIEIS